MVALDGAPHETPRRRVAAALLLLYALLYVLPLGLRPLASPDEVRYGEISREMLASGDWVSPRFNGVRYFEKPALGYWLNSFSLATLGETAFAVRLPVAIATGLTALLVFLFARRFATLFTAALAAGIFLTTFLVAGVGTLAVLDAFLALFLTGALAAYYAAIEEDRPARRRTYLLLCGAACAGAFLVKGFVALAIAVVVAAPYLVARRDWRTLLASPWLPMAAAAALALPWAVLIQLREPDFWHYFFWVEHIQRFAGDAPHTNPFWYYVAYLPIAGFPWILLLPAASIGLRDGGNDMKFLGYLAAWVLLPLLFLSFANGKLVTYILPCFAPLSILLAAGLERYLAGPRQRAFRAAAALLAVVFVAILAALLALQRMEFGGPLFSPTESPKLAAFAGSMIAGAGCAVFASLSTSRSYRLVAIAAIGAALVLPLQVALPDRVLEQVAPATAIARHSNAARDAIVVSDARLFGATAWSLKRNDIYVVSPGEIEYGLSYPEDRARWLDGALLERLIEENRGRHEIVIVIWPTSEPAIERQLPPAARREQHGNVILWRIPARGSIE